MYDHHRRCLLNLLVAHAILGFAHLFAPPVVVGQFPPDSLENLQVLPEDMEVRELIDIMRRFAIGLGVRCHYCHVGSEGQPLAEFDFVSDDKPEKRTARQMLRMVAEINQQHLAGLEGRGQPQVDVSCVTCHRGQARPVLIEDALKQAVIEGGSSAGPAKYRELRQRYYGSHTYDFREFVLVSVARDLWEMDERDAAIALAALNLEFFPESGSTHTLLGQAYMELGDRDTATMHLEKALEINPRNAAARRALDGIKDPN